MSNLNILSNDNIKPLPSAYQEIVGALEKHILEVEKDVVDFEGRHYNGLREEAVLYCLHHALDLSKGCLITANEGILDSSTTLCRALLETLFWSRYVTLSEENARELIDSSTYEMIRISRKNLTAKYGRIIDTRTNEEKTDEILNSPLFEGIPRRKSIENVAKDGGLERVYTNVYGFMSMIAHGKAFTLRNKSESKEELYANLSAALGTLECIEVIASDWIKSRKHTPHESISRLLGV